MSDSGSDFPPLYSAASVPHPPNLPLYTQCPSAHERILQSEPSSPGDFTVTHTRHCVFRTDHLEVDFGQFPSTLMYPAYGRNGVVEGRVRFKKKCSYVRQVTVKVRMQSAENQRIRVTHCVSA